MIFIHSLLYFYESKRLSGLVHTKKNQVHKHFSIKKYHMNFDQHCWYLCKMVAALVAVNFMTMYRN